MTSHIVLRPHSYPSPRRQPLLGDMDYSSHGGGSRMGEVVGGTTAECAAVCCCCPCMLMELLVVAIYKLPAGLCRRALWGKQRRRRTIKAVAPTCRCSEVTAGEIVGIAMAMSADKDVVNLEKEMWDRFYGAGFWRSPSQKSEMI